MFGSNAVSDHLPSILDFYNGKSIFLTGATGFIGSVLLEVLMRCFPGIKNIYIFIRTKKNVQSEHRKEKIFNKRIFKKLKQENPDSFEKIRVISGDIFEKNLGMSQDETLLLLQEVSIVFHCAGVINFHKPLEFVLRSNVSSLNTIIQLCRKMKKFEVLVYTSSAYSNCNRKNLPIKEEVYRLPSHAGKFLDVMKNENKEELQELFSVCKPDWPNTYCFSKCLAENVIADTASDLAVAIVRPSITIGSWKHPIPGYLEEHSGYTSLHLGIGKGFIKVINADEKVLLNLVPVDIVANTHVVAAWSSGTKKCASPFVVNCTANEMFEIKFKEYTKIIYKVIDKFPLPQSFVKNNNLIFVPNKYMYRLLAAFHHYFPAIFFDGLLRIQRKKAKLFSLYQSFDKIISSLFFFMHNNFEFERNNFINLSKQICPEDVKDLTLDFSKGTVEELLFSLPEGSTFYDWKKDYPSQNKMQKDMQKRYLQTKFIQIIFLMVCSLFIYWIFFFIFL